MRLKQQYSAMTYLIISQWLFNLLSHGFYPKLLGHIITVEYLKIRPKKNLRTHLLVQYWMMFMQRLLMEMGHPLYMQFYMEYIFIYLIPILPFKNLGCQKKGPHALIGLLQDLLNPVTKKCYCIENE